LLQLVKKGSFSSIFRRSFLQRIGSDAGVIMWLATLSINNPHPAKATITLSIE
jgi:hypothetical protein